MTDVDVLVIGSGAAGLCAALTAAEAGASVLVAESEHVVGGSSRLSGGVVMGGSKVPSVDTSTRSCMRGSRLRASIERFTTRTSFTSARAMLALTHGKAVHGEGAFAFTRTKTVTARET